MKRNFNKPEAFVRLFLGILLTVISFANVFEDSFIDNLLLGFGILLIVTAPFRFCPLYGFLGINKAKARNKPKMY